MRWLQRWRGKAEAQSTLAFEAVLADGKRLIGDSDFAAAEQCFRTALALNGHHAGTSMSLGFALLCQGRSRDALAPLRRALALTPGDADAHYLLGTALLEEHEPAEALAPLREAVRLQPDLMVARRDLGRALFETAQARQAEKVLQEALQIAPERADLHLFLGNVLAGERRELEAVASYRAALALEPDNPRALSSLAPALLALGDLTGAAGAARSALALEPGFLTARSNLLLALSTNGDCPPTAYLQEARQFERYCGAAPPPIPRRRARGPLRVGFVSGDLRSHPVGYFLAPLLAHRDSSAMRVVAYNNHPSRDALTNTLQQGFDLWREAWQLSDADLAEAVRADEIDVLVDLSGHTADNRLPVFARRAAPVQVSWLGYWASTGLGNMDFFIADEVSMAGGHDRDFVECIRCLPASRLCFSAPADPDVPLPAPLPALRNGYVTFGSFQRVGKIGDASLALWARVLTAIPTARLRLQNAYFGAADRRMAFTARLRRSGIEPSRVDLVGPQPRTAYLAAHAKVDVVLDTLMHTGATTTCEALWMGVPTLTLRGDRLVSRQGASIMNAAGLPGWVAPDEDAFVAQAQALTRDPTSLSMCRKGLRSSVSASPLMDGAAFAFAFQTLLLGLKKGLAK